MNKPPADWRSLRAWLLLRPWQRHSLVLMVGGLVYIGVGVSFLSIGDASPRRVAAIVIALRLFPIDGWGILFILTGLLACLSSRWPQFSDSWGYAVLCSMSSAWSAIFFLGYFLADAPSTNLISGFDWGLIAFIWWAVSGLKNPDRRSVVRYECD